MPKEQILESMEKHASLKVSVWKKVEKVIFVQEFPKGTIFSLKEFKMLSFVNKGILRMYYIDKNNKEITLKIYWNNNTLLNQYIYIHNIVDIPKNLLFIEVLENCRLSSIEHSNIEKLCDKHKCMEYFILLLNEAFQENISNRIEGKLTLDIEERYLTFMEKISKIRNKIKQNYLASYLGITPQTFSILKKKYTY